MPDASKKPDATLKTCFVVTPIGAPGSAPRKHADQVYSHIIEPVVAELGFAKPERADRGGPGMINRQIVGHLLNDDLVIADLSGSNANAFYELAIRHCTGKPFIQLMSAGEALPFDVAPQRTIFFDRTDWDSVQGTRDALRGQILEVMADGYKMETLIGHALDFDKLRGGTGLEQAFVRLADRVDALTQSAASPRAATFIVDDLDVILPTHTAAFSKQWRSSRERIVNGLDKLSYTRHDVRSEEFRSTVLEFIRQYAKANATSGLNLETTTDKAVAAVVAYTHEREVITAGDVYRLILGAIG